MKLFYGLVVTALAMPMLAQEVSAQTTNNSEDTIVVTGARERALAAGMLADTIEQTEVVDREDLISAQATVLSEALLLTPGARVNNECSMCGFKRVQLNGMAGHHTTFLIDGLPAHTLVSSFYGPDALSIAGVERIEVARGAGASLTAPEAIGGTVNVVTMEPNRTGGQLNAAAGENGYWQADAVGTYVNDTGSLRAIGSVQFDSRDQFDADSDGLSESPFLENNNYHARVSFDPTTHSTVSLRAGYIDSEVFGGPTIGDTTPSIGAAIASFADGEAPALFAGDDVRNRFIGNAWESSEWINTIRKELAGQYFVELSDKMNLDTGLSWSSHEQDSFYEGFDYHADNEMTYLTGRLNWSLNDDHLLTFGADYRDEFLRSQSDVAIGNPDFVSDSFDYVTNGFFVQDIWTPTPELEVSAVVRIDKIEADFIDPQRPGVEIDETLVSPRVDVRYAHNDTFTSRFSVGRGYRAPLSFFETDHGILDSGVGFAVDIDKLERSLSLTYALSYLGDRLTWTAGAAWTTVDNLAVLGETPAGVPLLTQLDDDGTVYGATFDLGYELTDTLSLSLTAEAFNIDESMRNVFAIATIEERLIAGLEWHSDPWDIDLTATWIGPRDLTDYGYEGYNDIGATIAKPTDVDGYTTIDARVEYELSDGVAIYAGGRNLLDYTQAGDEETPLMFDADGGFDVVHIYGPLRGRELYAGIRYEF